MISKMGFLYITHILIASITIKLCSGNDFCAIEDSTCTSNNKINRYNKESNEWYLLITQKITSAVENFAPCKTSDCSCHKTVLESDLKPFKDGITKDQFSIAKTKGIKYQIIDGKVFRERDCHFPARCSGVEHYLKLLAPKLPDLELVVNTRDWPQFNHAWKQPKAPIFSFSKTLDYYDIMYPAWSFWEGGPAISLYPTGIGRWDKHRTSISKAAEKWAWEKKKAMAFFRGSRTSEERDPLVLLSRSDPDLVDAQYTKNQAWKSDADTLYAPPAAEVSFENHCQYKYLFNYRGVAASFRFKHLFLCKSLVFHVGDEWLEFFYPSMKPWVHYVPIDPSSSKEEIKKYIEYFKENDNVAKEIAERGFHHIWDNLRDKDVQCYWKKLLKNYSKLIKYQVIKDEDLIEI